MINKIIVNSEAFFLLGNTNDRLRVGLEHRSCDATGPVCLPLSKYSCEFLRLFYCGSLKRETIHGPSSQFIDFSTCLTEVRKNPHFLFFYIWRLPKVLYVALISNLKICFRYIVRLVALLLCNLNYTEGKVGRKGYKV